MIRIGQLKMPVSHTPEELRREIIKALKIKENHLLSFRIARRSVDARKKPEVMFVYSIDAEVRDQKKVLTRVRSSNIQRLEQKGYCPPVHGEGKLSCRPVIVGTGPAGLLCGLLLARAGYCPILLERGERVEERQRKVEAFWHTGMLDTSSNVQFGEGGAGTFSDGKLNTAVKDATGRNRYVLESFVKAGAPEEILWLNKPHIGTDILRDVVKNIREEILSLGGEVRFQSRMTDLRAEQGQVTAIEINGESWMDCGVLVMAIGHSARDTFEMLAEKPLRMEAKAFAVGVRIQHPQPMIDLSQYGRPRGRELPAADYKLTRKLANGRGVYSFCMCPGGYVVDASSETGRTAVNGMSYHARDGKNANSAMVVTVSPADYGSGDALAGMRFQRRLEEAAYRAGEGRVPVQLLGDFCQGVPSRSLGEVEPAVRGRYALGDLKPCFPAELYESLREGITGCGRLIKGFDRGDALLAGVESRTSSPVKIPRNEECESSIAGLYPCGEGAGYAGGITSAAMDGLRVAESIIRLYAPWGGPR